MHLLNASQRRERAPLEAHARDVNARLGRPELSERYQRLSFASKIDLLAKRRVGVFALSLALQQRRAGDMALRGRSGISRLTGHLSLAVV